MHSIVIGTSYRKCCMQGYTLVEILLVIGVVAILAVMTVPGLQDSLSRNARESAALELVSSLGLARSEAVTRSQLVSICRSTNQTACAGSSGSSWNDGWIIFVDTGVAGTVDGADSIVEVQGAGNVPVNIILKTRVNGNFTGDFLQFDEDGFLKNSTTGAYYKLCPTDNVVANARAVWLSNTGRPALSTDGGNGVHNDLAGVDLVCP